MSKKTESPFAMHLVERQMLLSRMREEESPRRPDVEASVPYRFITIARDIGARGDDVAAELAGRLGWHVFDREIVEGIARDSRVRQDLVRGLDERTQSLIHDTVRRLLLMVEGISFGNEEYHEALLRTLAYLAARGDSVIVGRGGAYALRGEPGLHVRITASPEVRIRRLAERWQVAPDEARKRMNQIDTERRSFILHHFRQDLDNPRHYDLICDTDRLSVEQVVHAVVGLMSMAPSRRVTAAPVGHAPGPAADPRPRVTSPGASTGPPPP
jgi:cytidylate kinase